MGDAERGAEGARENLAARIVELERELAELKARQSGMQVLTGPTWVSDWYPGHEARVAPFMRRDYIHPGSHASYVLHACVFVAAPGRWASTPPAGFVGDAISASRPLEEAKKQSEEQILAWWASPACDRYRVKETAHG